MPTTQDNFKNRRRMAWVAFIAGVFGFPLWATATGLSVEAGADLVGTLVGPFYAFAGIIITAYIGAASYEHGRSVV